jgi:uncharacterized membrane protein YphA (DoxX/SURF4 family)
MEATTGVVPQTSTIKTIALAALSVAVVAQFVWFGVQFFSSGTPAGNLTRPLLFTGAFVLVLATRGNVRVLNMVARFTVAGAFLSALWNRFDNFAGFISYTAKVNSFLHLSVIPATAVLATIAEILCCALLIVGLQLPFATVASAVLLFMFASAMTLSGLSQSEWAVYVLSTGAFMLSTVDASLLSVDAILKNRPRLTTAEARPTWTSSSMS